MVYFRGWKCGRFWSIVRDANSDEDEIVRVDNSDEEHEDNPVVFDGFVDVDVAVVNISLG